jgi:hypothetical protein
MRRFVLVMFILAFAGLTIPSAFAQSCSITVQNAPGDTILVTATLFTNDPNENGEGEPLVFSSSGGEVSATVGAYSLPTPFTYVATAPNETISGFILGFDGDESCSITATVNPASGFTPSQKHTANKVALGGALLAIGAGVVVALTCVPPFTPLCIGLIIGGAAAGGGGAVSGFIGAEPADSNFTVIAVPNIATIPPLVPGGNLTAAEANAFNALYANEAAIIGIGTAAVTSANRAQGAHNAGNSFWEVRQVQAAQLYATELGPLYGAQVNILRQLHDALAAAGVSVNISPFDVFIFEEQILFFGLPQPLVEGLTEFGADQQTIDQLRQLLFVQDINAASGNFPDILVSPEFISALQDAAAAFSGVSIQIKPGSSSPVPVNPGSNGKIPVAILSSDTFDATTVDPSSVRFGPDGAENVLAATLEDVNGDGKLDLVFHFTTQDTGIKCGDNAAVLTGKTFAKQPFSGAESIVTVGCQ